LTIVSLEIIIISMETKGATTRHIPDLESHLGYWLRRVSNAVSGAFSRALQDKQTSVAEWVLVRELHERGQAAPGELADTLGLSRGAISKIVDKLETKGWIRTESNQVDSRFRLLSLTREGRRSLPILATVADANDAHFFGCLNPMEKRALRDLLTKIAVHHGIHDVPSE
jgi:DNA-binding MarR family transcriptional regulator